MSPASGVGNLTESSHESNEKQQEDGPGPELRHEQ